jgi:hypothetical protein
MADNKSYRTVASGVMQKEKPPSHQAACIR